MSDQDLVGELMERERGLVKAEARTEVFPTATERILWRMRREFPEITQDMRQEVAVEPQAKEFTGLQADLEACISAAEKVGELNARHPGFVNDRLQDVKRMMRRSLGWYTRPLRLFHGAVIRTLRQIVATLERQQKELERRTLQPELLRRVEDVERATCQTYDLVTSAIEQQTTQLQATGDELTALREDVRKLRAELAAATPQRLKDAIAERQ
jgi:hypothetical protein